MSDGAFGGLLKRIKRAFRSPLPQYQSYQAAFRKRAGIEIGGPSKIFRRDLPIYKVMRSLDGVNFSAQTVWEGALAQGQNFEYMKGRRGQQFIAEGSDLKAIADSSYDFLISCNNLEHLANPLKALAEWHRVVKPGGHILLVLPRKESNFDHRRDITSFEHLLEDLANGTDEHDLTHLPEILERHDRSMDEASGDLAAFRQRSLLNFENRCLHHHVFDPQLIDQMFEHAGMEVLLRTTTHTDHMALALKR
jgi:SAM-dependent methyltransferase